MRETTGESSFSPPEKSYATPSKSESHLHKLVKVYSLISFALSLFLISVFLVNVYLSLLFHCMHCVGAVDNGLNPKQSERRSHIS